MEFSSNCSCFERSISTPKSARKFSSCSSIFMFSTSLHLPYVHSHQSFWEKRRRCEDASRSGRGFPFTPFPHQTIITSLFPACWQKAEKVKICSPFRLCYNRGVCCHTLRRGARDGFCWCHRQWCLGHHTWPAAGTQRQRDHPLGAST